MSSAANTRYSAVRVLDANGRVILNTGGQYRVVFESEASMRDSPNEGAICIYGLSDSDNQGIVMSGARVELYAGEDAACGMIFSGEIVDVGVLNENQVTVAIISVVDGDAFYTASIVRSFKSGASLGGIIEDCARYCTSPVDIGHIMQEAYAIKLPRGVATMGSPMDKIREISKTLNASAYILGGRLYVMGLADKMSGAAIVISQANGLIGIPSRDSYYVSFQHDIRSALSVGGMVRFDAEAGGGLYRIMSIVSNGDTKEGPWRMTISGLAQGGTMPAMTAETTNIWR